MAQTVIGIFDSASEAQQAVQQLISSGLNRNQIDISSQTATESRTSSGSVKNDDNHSSFFKSLLDNDDEANTYSDVARRGSVVTVHAQSSEQAQSAARILDQYGAVDVNERAMGSNAASSTNAGTSIPVIEEELQVGKRVATTSDGI